MPGETRRRSERLPEINELLTFIVASDEQSLSRAAAALHVSGAAVAKRLDNLEAILGRKLLDRGNRGVRLTDSGRELYLPAERLVADAKALLDRTQPGNDGKLTGIQALLRRPAARSPEALAAELERLIERLFDTVPPGIVVQRVPDGVFLEVNAALCRMIEYPRQALLGHTPLDLGLFESTPGSDETCVRLTERSRTTGTIRTRSGASLRVEMITEPMTIANQELALTVVTDITREDELEQKLQVSDRRSALLLELAEMMLDRQKGEAVLAATLRAVKGELGLSEVAIVAFRNGSEHGQLLSALGSTERLTEFASERRYAWEGAESLVELDENERRGARRLTGIRIPGPLTEPRVLLMRAAIGATLGSDDLPFLHSITRMIMHVLDD